MQSKFDHWNPSPCCQSSLKSERGQNVQSCRYAFNFIPKAKTPKKVILLFSLGLALLCRPLITLGEVSLAPANHPLISQVKRPTRLLSRHPSAHLNKWTARNSGFHEETQLGISYQFAKRSYKSAKSALKNGLSFGSNRDQKEARQSKSDARALAHAREKAIRRANQALDNKNIPEAHKQIYLAERAHRALKPTVSEHIGNLVKTQKFQSPKKNSELAGEAKALKLISESDHEITELKKRLPAGPRSHEMWVRKNQADLEIRLGRARLTGRNVGAGFNALKETGITAAATVATSGALAPTLVAPAANGTVKVGINSLAQAQREKVWKDNTLSSDERTKKLDEIDQREKSNHKVRDAVYIIGTGVTGVTTFSSAPAVLSAPNVVSAGGHMTNITGIVVDAHTLGSHALEHVGKLNK